MPKYHVIYWDANGAMVEDEFEAKAVNAKEVKGIYKVTFDTIFGKRKYSSDRHTNLDWSEAKPKEG